MLYVAPELSAKYELVTANGFRAVFNDTTDPDYVGVLTEVSGFDSAEVREDTQNYARADGAVHGRFFFGRRPFTMTGRTMSTVSTIERQQRLGKLQAAVNNSVRQDSTLYWTLASGTKVYLNVRGQSPPLRITGGWVKDFQMSMVSADPRIYADTLSAANVVMNQGSGGGMTFPLKFPLNFGVGSPAGQLLVNNQGSASADLKIAVTGPATNPTIQNYTTGESIVLLGSIGADDTWTIDTANRTVTNSYGSSVYGAVSSAPTTWWMLEPGLNDIRALFTSSSGTTSMSLTWRDAWI